MCGILGGINIEKSKLYEVLPSLYHRGPDEHGIFSYDNIHLLHARLKIQDLETGQQPFVLRDLVLVLNGEIYNHQELRRKYNLECKTRSDTETFALLYEKYGIDILNEIDGMFAFAFFNMKERKLVIGRDRAGKKPLYYFCRGRKFAFSSELNTLKLIETFGINHRNISQYLRYAFTGSSTPYQDINELEAGTCLSIKADDLNLTYNRWWSILEQYKKPSICNLQDALLSLEDHLDKSVSLRLQSSDLEVGVFLSGGIDSGLVTAFASKYAHDLKTFTVAFNGLYDESHLAKLVSEKFNTRHHLIKISFENLAAEIENILPKYGEPFGDSSAIPSFFVSREAKKYLTVILNGDGGDEIFGGYRRYVPFRQHDFLAAKRPTRNLYKFLSGIMPFPVDKQNWYNYLYRLIDFAGKPPLEGYLSSTVDTFEGYEDVFIPNEILFEELNKFIDKVNLSGLSGLQKIMCIDFQYLLPNDLLVKMDIATMANSLEGRCPFLGKSILEFAPSLSDNLKINGITTKFILRKLAGKYLPDEITKQPKRGFEVPLKTWIENDLHELVSDYLTGNTFCSEFVKKSFIRDLLDNRAHVPAEKRAKMLWYMMALEIWHRKCYLNR
ncbi:MAG TPA: asparagine synthase (glutamine-hydrolyzing) [Bacteroidales bacterium]|jgi:asparagine synthase (glutamine-hydrolysing)|nr:MAG: Asparagine synthetase (glutamine-hydrolyzing) 1 [Bacteroidetes bacterium ADurb.Bin145]HOU03058.1 asparagine synthase (glutamine-hydrolyzing) [Bacteroidales bacterium]HQK66771.1 asparagine synthase (glutamine-hydrolyzing) [Bacteroidales bacterium]